VICTTGIISMTCEMCLINGHQGNPKIATLTQCITLTSSTIVFIVIADALRRLNKIKGTKLILSIRNLFI